MKNYFFLASLIVLHRIQQKNGSRLLKNFFSGLLIHGCPISQLNYKGNNVKLENQKWKRHFPRSSVGGLKEAFQWPERAGPVYRGFLGAADRLVAVSSPQLDSKGSIGPCPQGISHLPYTRYSKNFQRFESVPIGFLAHFYPGQGGRLVFFSFFLDNLNFWILIKFNLNLDNLIHN